MLYAKISKSIKARNLFLNICLYHLKLKKTIMKHYLITGIVVLVVLAVYGKFLKAKIEG